ncbi:MAG TPA: ABC transporter permease [Gemmatimonadaceae bacterium]|nr:ABC transporter permease [Gemmatimonadaceae bacterium]
MSATAAPASSVRERRGFREHPLVRLVMVRFLEFWREPEAVFWVFIFPILLAAGLGIAFRERPPEAVKVGVLVSDPAAGALTDAIARDPRLEVVPLDDSAGMHALRTGRIALFAIPRAARTVEYRYDDTRPDARTARLLVDDAVQRAAGREDVATVRERRVREPGARYIDFVVPGLLAMNLMGSGIWGVGFTIVEARRRKLLKRLIATPMSRAQYLASFILSRLAMLVLEVGGFLAFGILVFGVPARGSFGTIALVALTSALAFSAIGLLVASRVRTIEGASGLMNLVMLPMWIFSGVFFSASNFPDAAQPVIQALPLTAAVDALRATLLEGASVVALAPELAILAAWLSLSFASALALFRWR